MNNLDQLAQRIELVNRLSHSINPENRMRRELPDIIESTPHLSDDEVFQVVYAVVLSIKSKHIYVEEEVIEQVTLHMLAHMRVSYPDNYRTKDFNKDLPKVLKRIRSPYDASPFNLINTINGNFLHPYMELRTIVDVADLIKLELHATDMNDDEIKIIITNVVASAAKLQYHHEIKTLLAKASNMSGGYSDYNNF